MPGTVDSSDDLVTSSAVNTAIAALSIPSTITLTTTPIGTFLLNSNAQDMNDPFRYYTWGNAMNANCVRHANNTIQGNGSLINVTQKSEFTISAKLLRGRPS